MGDTLVPKKGPNWGHARYFYFFLLGECQWGVRGAGRRGGGSVSLLKVPGGRSPGRKGPERPGGCLQQIGEFGGGGAKYLVFRGRNVHQERDKTNSHCEFLAIPK